MSYEPQPSAYRYLAARDRFVRIRALDPRSSELGLHPDMDGESFRRAVIAACVRGGPGEELDLGNWMEDPETQAGLYELVVETNPALDLRSVALFGPATEAAPLRRGEGRVSELLIRKSRGLEDRLNQRVIGQQPAVRSVASAVRRAAAEISEVRGPLATLLFLGNTGTGKTELTRAMAEELFGLDNLVRIDCSEFGDGHETSRLVGSPPGYVGHTEGGYLTDAVRKTPRCVVLFDEIEKAHERLHHLLLQVLDEGRLTDGQGRTAQFNQAFIVLTSNAGTAEMQRAQDPTGFAPAAPSGAAAREILERAIRARFRPEFLSRIDEAVRFRDLDRPDAIAIARKKLGELAIRARRRGRRIRISRSVAPWVAERGHSLAEGARGIASVIRREIETPLADVFLNAPQGTRWFDVRIRRGQPWIGPTE